MNSTKLAVPPTDATLSTKLSLLSCFRLQELLCIGGTSSEEESDDQESSASGSRTCSSCSSFSTKPIVAVRNDNPPRQPTKTLFVGNLAVEVTEGMLHELFSQFGLVVECCKRWYHYAFIQYSTEYEAQQALQALDGHRIQGRAMRVEFQRKKIKAILRTDDTLSAVAAGAQRAIYVSVAQTDSYFTKPGEQVMPCVNYKTYELFPAADCDSLSTYLESRAGSKASRQPKAAPAMETADLLVLPGGGSRRKYVHALRLLQR